MKPPCFIQIRQMSCLLLLLLLPLACVLQGDTSHVSRNKIEFDPSILDPDGLRGPPDGKMALSYEFKIPNTEACRKAVKAIDPSVAFMCGSRGRVGAGENECLCIGSTHQHNFNAVLLDLARLQYVERIIECHFE